MSKAYEIALRRAGQKKILNNEQIERLDKLHNQLDALRVKSDEISKKVFEQEQWMKKNTASPKQQDQYDANVLIKADRLRQLKGIQLLIDEIEK